MKNKQRLCLGKLPFVAKSTDLMFASYRTKVALPPHPKTFGHASSVPRSAWGMLGNDQLGDCAIAGPMHMSICWTVSAGLGVTFTVADAIRAYSSVSGYRPGIPATDRGCQMRDVLRYWQKTGFRDAKGKLHTIGAYINIPTTDLSSMQEAMWLFGGVNSGLMVPQSMQTQFQNGKPLTVVKGSPIEGGHCMPLLGRNASGYDACTWGSVVTATDAFVKKYYDEHWAVLSNDQLNGKGVSPELFNMAQLQADLNALA
jgi:hypothetical protein